MCRGHLRAALEVGKEDIWVYPDSVEEAGISGTEVSGSGVA